MQVIMHQPTFYFDELHQQANLISPPVLVCSFGLDITLSREWNGDNPLDENGLPHWRLARQGEHLKSDWYYLELTAFCIQETTLLPPSVPPRVLRPQRSTSSVSPESEPGLHLAALHSGRQKQPPHLFPVVVNTDKLRGADRFDLPRFRNVSLSIVIAEVAPLRGEFSLQRQHTCGKIAK
jgi:hypothetical protein